ncbi:MucR family transcriptional regulator [Kitasatospora sp. NPDC088779]|uniref:MucR family transcriptional regulator n=1 Tax=Kitasatospora sp. NPDC088779 TaxID=3154964 RepID=UPI00342C9388
MTGKRICDGCGQRRAVVTGLCLRCYRRKAAGKPLVDPQVARIGQIDGHGQYGIFDDDGSTVLCHECGRRLKGLAFHVNRAHGMSAAQYREAHGLARGLALISADLRDTRSELSRSRIGTPAWNRFEAARDPAAAAAARDLSNFSAQVRLGRAQQSRANGRTARQAKVRTCPHCGAQWCPLPGGYNLKTCRSKECQHAERSANATARALKAATEQRPLTPDETQKLRDLTGHQLLDLVRALLQDGIQQRTIAPAIGISPAGLSRLLHGHHVPSTDQPRPALP